jgi:hypothetical protein
VLKNVATLRPDPSAEENAALLRELVPGVPVVEFPWIPDSRDWDGLALIAERSGLMGILTVP